MQAQRSRFDLSWYLFLRCATVPARFRFRPFGRACLPLIPDAPDCICSPGHLWFWVVWASCLGAAAPISIHAPRVGRDAEHAQLCLLAGISIHAPRVGRDDHKLHRRRRKEISIHAPRVGRDWDSSDIQRWAAEFRSTRPVWGATREKAEKALEAIFQSTRPVWGATANLTILTRQICTKGTKEFLLGRKTHEERGKITQKLAYIHAFSAFFRCEGARTFCALVLRTQ